jgi:hypothetical protein
MPGREVVWAGYIADAVAEWMISPKDRAAYVDLRKDDVSFGDAEVLIEKMQPYYPTRQLSRIILDVRGLHPLPGPVEVLIQGLKGQAEAQDIRVEVLAEGAADSIPTIATD